MVQLTTLDLSNNLLTGSLPSAYSNLTKVGLVSAHLRTKSRLSLAQLCTNNGLVSAQHHIRSECYGQACLCLQLEELDLHGNYLNHSLPQSWGELYQVSLTTWLLVRSLSQGPHAL